MKWFKEIKFFTILKFQTFPTSCESFCITALDNLAIKCWASTTPIIRIALSEFNIPKKKINKIIKLTTEIIKNKTFSRNLAEKLKP